jgi:KipI family sensor histidine kinase inhibitor
VTVPALDVHPMGDAAVVVTRLGAAEARALGSALRARDRPGIRDVVEGLGSVLVTVDPGSGSLGELASWISSVDTAGSAPPPARTVVVPTVWGGPDTDEVCRMTGLSSAELAGMLSATELTVAATGFSPGFAYLEGLPHPLSGVPRRPHPRPVVPAGSVAIAGGFAAVYPQATPGGWHLVGHTGLPMFDPSTPPYVRLRTGDRVRFEPVPAADDAPPGGGDATLRATGRVGPARRAPLRPTPGRQPVFAVEDAGLLSVIEDSGRAGVAHLGVPGAGPADPLAHELANRLVGNAPGGAAIEVTARGPRLRALADVFVAAVGAAPVVVVDGREVRDGHVVPVARGQRVEIPALRGGLRTYLALRGSFDVPSTLGSCSTDVLSWIGPGPLRRGDELGAGPQPDAPMADHLSPVARAALDAGRGQWELRVLPGPHADVLGPTAFERLTGARFTVDPASDRIGVRLRQLEDGKDGGHRDLTPEGAGAIASQGGAGAIASQGMVTGAVQVPSDGAPIVLGPDHATLGGYPVVAVVTSADLWMLGQCRPGEVVVLRPIDLADAERAFDASRRLAAAAVAGRYPMPPGW